MKILNQTRKHINENIKIYYKIMEELVDVGAA